MSSLKLPCRVQISSLEASRYAPSHERPASWDRRVDGIDVVRTADGQTIKLQSDGQQSPPKEGWIILLTGGNGDDGYIWTLYGIPAGARASDLSGSV